MYDVLSRAKSFHGLNTINLNPYNTQSQKSAILECNIHCWTIAKDGSQIAMRHNIKRDMRPSGIKYICHTVRILSKISHQKAINFFWFYRGHLAVGGRCCQHTKSLILNCVHLL